MIKDITNEMITYLRFCGGIEDRQDPYPPDLLLKTVFKSRFYKYLELEMENDKHSRRQFMSYIFGQVIPYLCSILPDTLSVFYRDDIYDPNIYIQQDYQDIGTINLAKYRFEYEESSEIVEERSAIAEIKENIRILQIQIQNEIETSEAPGLFSGKRKLREKEKTIQDLGNTIEAMTADLTKHQNTLDEMIAKERNRNLTIRSISQILQDKLRMPAEAVVKEAQNAQEA